MACPTSQSQIMQATAKNAQPKLALTRIEQVLLPVPSDTAEQGQIIGILDAIGEKVNLHKRKQIVLEELFKALLNRLMTGEISVSNLDLSALEKPPGATMLTTEAPA